MSNTNLDDVLNPTPVDATEGADVVDDSTADATEVTESIVTEPETDVDNSNVVEPSADATESDTAEVDAADTAAETSDDATTTVTDDGTNSEVKAAVAETCNTWELKQPTPIYRGTNKNTAFTSISGVVEVKGEPIHGFVAVSCGIRGVGKVDGYIESAYVGW